MFRFSLRELLLATLMVAMGVAWWLDRSQLASDAGRYKDALMKLRRMGISFGDVYGTEMQSDLNSTYESEHAARKQAKSRAR